MRTMVALALVAATLLAAGAASSLPGSGGPPEADGQCTPSHVPHLGQACLRGDGLWDVVLADGRRLPTHGPDPWVPALDEPGFGDDAEQRPPVCASRSRLTVLYGHPAGAPDRSASVADDLRAAVRRMNAVLNADALASGGPTADYRVECDPRGDIAVHTFPGPAASATSYDAVVDAAIRAGHTARETDYLLFYDGSETGICGVANLYGDTSPTAQNSNLVETGYGVVYEGCWFGRTPMHENGHNQGAVQDLAPMWDGTGHCLEGLDVLCYPGQSGVTGTATLGLVLQCSDRVHYDCNFDTYFDAAPEAGEWLATNWNIGSPVNRYLAFADATGPRAGTTAAAAAANGTEPAASPAPPANATTPARPSSSGTSSSSPTGRPATPSPTRAPPRTVADTRTQAQATDGPPATGPATIEVPGAAAGLALAALVGAAAVRRRLR